MNHIYQNGILFNFFFLFLFNHACDHGRFSGRELSRTPETKTMVSSTVKSTPKITCTDADRLPVQLKTWITDARSLPYGPRDGGGDAGADPFPDLSSRPPTPRRILPGHKLGRRSPAGQEDLSQTCAHASLRSDVTPPPEGYQRVTLNRTRRAHSIAIGSGHVQMRKFLGVKYCSTFICIW